MVTGVEAAGLALAIFPILLQGLAKVKELKDQDGALKRLIRELKMEKCKFVNTNELLLCGMSISEERIKILVSGEGWGDSDFQAQLERHMGIELAEAFTESVEALHSSLKDLSKDIGLDGHRKPRWRKLKNVLQQNDHDAVLQKIDKINRDLAQLTMQRPETAAVRIHARTSAMTEHYNRIRNHATRLYEVLQQKFSLCRASHDGTHCACLRLSRVAPRQTTGSDDLQLKVLFDFDGDSGTRPWDWFELDFRPMDLRQHKHTLEEGHEIGSGGNCSSESDSVDEQVIPTGRRKKIGKAIVTIGTVAVGLMGGLERERITNTTKPKKKTVGFQVEIETETRRPTALNEPYLATAQAIDDLCSAVAGAAGQSPIAFTGTISDEWHCVKPPRPLFTSSYMRETVSLHDLLIPGCLEKKIRLQLGVELASAVMQLHETEWLNESWGNRDISFLQRSDLMRKLPNGTWIPVPVADKPIVRRVFERLKAPQNPPELIHSEPSQPNSPQLIQYDKSLFSLGIVLIEIWYERHIHELRDPSQANIPFNENAAFDTAVRSVGSIFSTAGDLYGLAVSRCLNGLNRPIESTQAGRRDLQNSKFKNEVQSDIVSLLERNLEAYTTRQDS
ncbi:hypothetical protein K440DRAFT_663845 [Wilcoxina mikolae CBS 423.85]|nr:hypothetical protein K440DRAFT_663845 [Wilcoxina mikolae CBS 423.85]